MTRQTLAALQGILAEIVAQSPVEKNGSVQVWISMNAINAIRLALAGNERRK
jgi:hypothetical protein